MVTDVVVVGAGLVGTALAWRLRQRGARVVLLERDRPGCEASSAAAGILSAEAEPHGPEAFAELLRSGLSLYEDFAGELRVTTGIDCDYRSEGLLYLCLSDEDEKKLQGQEKIEASELRKLEPAITPTARWAARFPTERQLDTHKLMAATVAAALAAGVELRCGESVEEITIDGGRVTGVRTGSQTFSSGAVVNCAGAWSSLIRGTGFRTDLVQPARGQMVCLQAPAAQLRHIVYSSRGYIVPRLDGRVLAGSTVEMAGFKRETTAAGIRSILERALEIAPALGDAAIQETWCGFRPRAADDLPILGAMPVRGLFAATGHFRNGILLAPITAERMAGCILEEREDPVLAPFSPSRFF